MLSEKLPENAEFVFHHLQAKKFLSALLVRSFDDESLQDQADKIICTMLELNDRADPDTVARAAYFVVKSKRNPVSEDDVRRIRKNGGRENNSWPALVPIITDLLRNQE